ncbi:MAG: proline iminopeptidase-family hydrolase [Gammaproteobacteria bacterium]
MNLPFDARLSRRRLLQIAAACLLPRVDRSRAATSAAPAGYPDPDDVGTVAVEGGHVWYRLDGRRHFARGRAPLVVLHGGPGASHHYLLPLVALASERPVVLYDQLDCGNAARPGAARSWTVERYVDEIDRLRNALGLDRLVLLGSSCGATWVAEYAMRRPAGLLGAVLASPFLSAHRWHADAARLRAALPAAVRATLEQHEAAGTTDTEAYHAADLEWMRRHVCRLDPWPPYVARTLELFNGELYGHMWGASESSLTGVLADYEAEERLGGLDLPVLYTCGEHDEATPASTRAFAAATPGAAVEVFAGASHMPHAESAVAYAAALGRFLAHVEP